MGYLRSWLEPNLCATQARVECFPTASRNGPHMGGSRAVSSPATDRPGHRPLDGAAGELAAAPPGMVALVGEPLVTGRQSGRPAPRVRAPGAAVHGRSSSLLRSLIR